ncbi:GNAT family N-acetyltransferase [Chitinophagales bacterium]|nr:GNAT family N-acetyltransferase [Chitinophagales bacterium]
MAYSILNSYEEDLQAIRFLYDSASAYQRIKFPENEWPLFSDELILTDIQEKRHWKLVKEGVIVCSWVITFSDELIWEELNVDPAIYIHRIATHPQHRGANYVGIITEWAKEYAREQGKEYIRLDTCGKNDRLIQHYQVNGFELLGIWSINDSSQLPSHYRNPDVCFFQMRLL